MIASQGGDVLTDTQPFSQVYFTAGYRTLQEKMADLGSQRVMGHAYLLSLPPAGTLDPGSQTCLTWQNFFDGVNYYVPPNTPVLPGDFLEPLKIKQRPSGMLTHYREMECSPNGIPAQTKVQWIRHWLWREDGLWMTGGTQAMDLEIDYIAYLPDLVTTITTPWYEQQVPITRCGNALSWYIAAEVGGARGDVDADALRAKGDAATIQLVNRQFRSRQRVNQRRKSYRSLQHGHRGWDY